MFLAREINAKIRTAKDDILGEHSHAEFCALISSLFHKYGVRVEVLPSDECKDDEVLITGYYDGNLTSKKIGLVFVVSKDSTHIQVADQISDWFLWAMSLTLQHELIHKFQDAPRDYEKGLVVPFEYKGRNPDLQEERAYLSDPDEIEAYAHDIVYEVLRHYPDRDPYYLLSHPRKIRKSFSLTYYRKTFRGTNWTKIRKRLFKKIYRWLPYCIKENSCT